mgnify:CR=1 FL=1
MNIRPIVTRELRSYLTSPSIFVAVAAFLFLSGFLFYGTMSNYADLSANAEYRRQMGFEVLNYTKHVVGQVFFAINLLLVFIIPILTMRLIAEERKSGTFEVLRSLPFSDWDIVLAKFTACFLLTLILVALNSYQILVMLRFGSTEFLVILVATLGMILTAAAYVSIGLFASSLTESQITAAIIACVALLALWLIGDIGSIGSMSILNRIAQGLSLRIHSETFSRGVLRIDDVAYFVLITYSFLFMTVRSLELNRNKI